MSLAFDPNYDLANQSISDPSVVLAKADSPVPELFEHGQWLGQKTKSENESIYATHLSTLAERDEEKLTFDRTDQSFINSGHAMPKELRENHNTKMAAFKKRLMAYGKKPMLIYNHAENVKFIGRFKPGQIHAAKLDPLESFEASLDQLEAIRAEMVERKADLVRDENLPREEAQGMAMLTAILANQREGGKPNIHSLFFPDDFDSKGNFRISNSRGRIEYPQAAAGLDAMRKVASFAKPD
jgi:hypothetical protein